MVDEGANPALYINSKGTTLIDYLLSEFDNHFNGVNAFKKLKTQEDFYREIVHYYSIVNVISEKYDFSWEREWRYSGHFEFDYVDVVAIVAKNPEKFEKKCGKEFKSKQLKKIRRIPVISPYWSY